MGAARTARASFLANAITNDGNAGRSRNLALTLAVRLAASAPALAALPV
ncbi:hypothetical protein ACVWXO_010701 [Bradyrhizobium sp. LM2.7]